MMPDQLPQLIDRPLTIVRDFGTSARVIAFHPWPHGGSLLGHVDVNFNGLQILRIPIFVGVNQSLSVGVLSAPEVDGEGRQRARDGKRLYWPLIGFCDRDVPVRWQHWVLDALQSSGIEL
jgi:hypothetical protein